MNVIHYDRDDLNQMYLNKIIKWVVGGINKSSCLNDLSAAGTLLCNGIEVCSVTVYFRSKQSLLFFFFKHTNSTEMGRFEDTDQSLCSIDMYRYIFLFS